MNIKQRRARLFSRGKPTVRPMQPDDLKWLWAANVMREDAVQDQQEFTDDVLGRLQQFDEIYILEDRKRRSENGQLPVGVVTAHSDGWALDPHVDWFPWARSYNKVRCAVAFFTLARFSGRVGVVRVHSDEENYKFFSGLHRYVPIKRGGKIPRGRPGGGCDHIFYVPCKTAEEVRHA